MNNKGILLTENFRKEKWYAEKMMSAFSA